MGQREGSSQPTFTLAALHPHGQRQGSCLSGGLAPHEERAPAGRERLHPCAPPGSTWPPLPSSHIHGRGLSHLSCPLRDGLSPLAAAPDPLGNRPISRVWSPRGLRWQVWVYTGGHLGPSVPWTDTESTSEGLVWGSMVLVRFWVDGAQAWGAHRCVTQVCQLREAHKGRYTRGCPRGTPLGCSSMMAKEK